MDGLDPAERRYLEDEDTPTMKTIKGATTGLVAGTIFGTIVATWYDVPRVERSVALPGLIRTLKMMGNYGMTFAAIGGVYIGVEQLVQHYRSKRDFVNGAVGGFVAGSTILGYKGRSIATAISAGAALAVTSALIDAGARPQELIMARSTILIPPKKDLLLIHKLTNDLLSEEDIGELMKTALFLELAVFLEM